MPRPLNGYQGRGRGRGRGRGGDNFIAARSDGQTDESADAKEQVRFAELAES